MQTKRSTLIFVGLIVLALALWFMLHGAKKVTAPVTHPQEQPTYVHTSADSIVVDLPFPGAVVGKTFSVIGKARGWYFEGSFPVEVLDQKGNQLSLGVAQAQGDWMTQDFVAFKADIVVPQTYIGPATVVLKKDNPSGLPQNDASMSFPITIEY